MRLAFILCFYLFGFVSFANAQLVTTLCPSGCDFNSFQDLADNIDVYMSPGGVVVEVASGTYTEQVSFGPVSGASNSNKIVVRSASRDSADVIITAPSSSTFSDPNYVIELDSASYFRFEDISFRRTGSSTYAKVVNIKGPNITNRFERCRFQGATSGSNSNKALITVVDTDNKTIDLTISRCSFQDGYAGVFLEGSTSLNHHDIVVSECQFKTYRFGAYMRYATDVTVFRSAFTNADDYNTASCMGIYGFALDSALNISSNYIYLNDANNNTGIELSNCDGHGSYSLVVNNEIIVGGSSCEGIVSGSLTSYKNYYHNSILSTGTNNTSSPAFYANGSQFINLRNNILAHTNGGLALQLLTPTNNYTTDYNLLWSTGTDLAKWSSTAGTVAGGVASWQSASGQASNSLLGNPQFASAISLVAGNSAIVGAGTPLVSVSGDIENSPRSGTAPYLGAYERQGGPCASFAVDSVVVADVLCNGDSSGTITVYASGGSGPYSYSNGVSATLPALQATEEFNSDQLLHFSGAPLSFYWSPSTCTGGSFFDYSATGGCTGGSAYYNGSGSSGFSGCFLRTPQADASGLNAVTLNFDVTHSYNVGRPNDSLRFYIWINNGFQSQSIVPVTVNGVSGRGLKFDRSRTCENIEVVFDISNAGLADKSDMLLYIETNCGYSNCNSYFAYVDNVQTLQGGSSGGGGFQSSSTFTGLPAGSYTITVEDINGCQATYSNNPAVVNEPLALQVSLSNTPPTGVGATDGKVWATVSGGSPSIGGSGGYTYSWSGGVTGLSSDTIVGLASGNYCVTVTDANGCDVSACTTITGPICNLAITNVSTSPISCHNGTNGSITVTASGGSGQVEYSINGGSSWSTNNVFNGLGAGPYNVQVRDAQGCTDTDGSNPYVLSNPAPINLTIAATPVSTAGGNDGALSVSVTSGGTPQFTYEWNNNLTGQSITNLIAGTYCVTVSDANNCTVSACETVTQPGCSIAVSNVVVTDVACNGASTGSITVTQTGGAAPVDYSIDGGATWQSSGVFNNLPAGNYNIIVQDVNNCQAAGSGNPYAIQQPTSLSISGFLVTNESSAGAADGSIDQTTTGGTSPYTYQWNTGSTTEDITNLTPGIYCLTATDANGCIATRCDTVKGLSVPPCSGFSISSVQVTQPVCNGQQGSIIVNVSGGQNPILYSADSGTTFQNGISLFNVGAGTYEVLVRDNAGCELIFNGNPITINAVPALNPTISRIVDTLSVTGSFVDYTWQLNGDQVAGGSAASSIVASQSGNYTVIVEDANGCKDTSSAFSFVYSGLDDNALADFRVWPVPASNKLHVEFPGVHLKDVKVELWSITGQQLMVQPIEANTGTLDVSHLAKGMYWLLVSNNQQQLTRKVLIQ